MNRVAPLACPACSGEMRVTELTCPHCATRVQGQFDIPALLRLNREQLQFVEVFLRCRGNIREVERDLKISYPTVRARLDQVIQSLGYPVQPTSDIPDSLDAVLDELDRGTPYEEAIKRVRGGDSL
ncbi:hypothetical protein GCM10025857_33540 [Alicyclobacillus contaminans]|uniref:DUF2089 domain-containing protein n=1 Tax=Alicyclobacillus contaminans TaxID=392016 RepID=UPI000552B663|nr:DUF2089 domain-containing protein [Alicyclobacillus contaminans]GMA51997.1 hypothetical protein GCM10025857_33540 [Alicyclobacillus contaminans]